MIIHLQLNFQEFFYPSLTFKFHISKIKSKLSKALYALRMVKNTLNQNSLLLLYNSIFHCHLLYAIKIWSCSRSGPLNEIFKMQKSAIRIITGSSYNSHQLILYNDLNSLSTSAELSKFSILTFHSMICFKKNQYLQIY